MTLLVMPSRETYSRLRDLGGVNCVTSSTSVWTDRRKGGFASPLAIFVCVAATLLQIAPTLAGEPSAGDSKPGTIITLGGFGVLSPKFEGSKSDELSFRPIIGWRSVGDREWLDMPNDGLDYELIETENFRAGVVGNFRWQRDTDSLVRGFKRGRSIDLSIEAGGFAEYWPALWLRTRAEVRAAVLGADGFVADLSADIVLNPAERWTLTAGPRLSVADQSYMDSYYSVTPAQSVTSGLATYEAGAGLRSYGLGAGARYKWSDDLTSLAFVEYSRLAAHAAESPLIDERGSADQFTFGLGLKYSFRVN
jgi:MipA family protein